jgi:hypothetical protein
MFAIRVGAMNRAEFEADILREGYEVREGSIEPHRDSEAHAHLPAAYLCHP